MNKKILKSIILSGLLLSSSFANDRIKQLEEKITDLESYIEEVEENLGKVETRSYSDKIQFGLGMRVEANNIDTTYADNSSPNNEEMVYRTKFYLNMKAKIAYNLKFSGRLSSYKNWGDSNKNRRLMADMDSRQGRMADSSSQIYVERAYLDWLITNNDIPLTLTLGRQPSSDGPSFQIKEGTERKGTYDALAFDGAADGIVMTANLSKVTSGNTAVRVNYAKPNYSDYNTNMKDTKVTGFFLDKTCDMIKQQHLFQMYFVRAVDLDGNPNLADSNGTSTDKNVGDFDIYGAMFEIQHLNNFSFFLHYAHSVAKPNGKTVDLTALGGGATEGLLTSTTGDTEKKTGNAFWTGIRYDIQDWAVGAEYNKGSKYWFSATYAPNYPLNKLATRGDASEIYISKKINKFANIRVGYLDINYDYSGSGSHLGAPRKITSNMNNANKIIKEISNLYINFNVLF